MRFNVRDLEWVNPDSVVGHTLRGRLSYLNYIPDERFQAGDVVKVRRVEGKPQTDLNGYFIFYGCFIDGGHNVCHIFGPMWKKSAPRNRFIDAERIYMAKKPPRVNDKAKKS